MFNLYHFIVDIIIVLLLKSALVPSIVSIQLFRVGYLEHDSNVESMYLNLLSTYVIRWINFVLFLYRNRLRKIRAWTDKKLPPPTCKLTESCFPAFFSSHVTYFVSHVTYFVSHVTLRGIKTSDVALNSTTFRNDVALFSSFLAWRGIWRHLMPPNATYAGMSWHDPAWRGMTRHDAAWKKLVRDN